MSRESEIRGKDIIYNVFYYCFVQEDLKPENLSDKDVLKLFSRSTKGQFLCLYRHRVLTASILSKNYFRVIKYQPALFSASTTLCYKLK